MVALYTYMYHWKALNLLCPVDHHENMSGGRLKSYGGRPDHLKVAREIPDLVNLIPCFVNNHQQETYSLFFQMKTTTQLKIYPLNIPSK